MAPARCQLALYSRGRDEKSHYDLRRVSIENSQDLARYHLFDLAFAHYCITPHIPTKPWERMESFIVAARMLVVGSYLK